MDPYFKNNEMGWDVWVSKYKMGDETFPEFFQRLTTHFVNNNTFLKKGVHQNEDKLSTYGKIRFSKTKEELETLYLNLFNNFGYIVPGGSVLAGVGSSKPISLSNCFVIENNDSIQGIFDAGKDAAEIYKRRGGVGVDLSNLRPRGATVNNAAKTTSGIVPFMELYSTITNTIGQEGRRGALMLSIDINHPDSPEFITAKQDLTKVTGANVSVRLNNEFMEAVKNDADYILRWPTYINSKFFFDEEIKSLPYNELIEFNNSLETNKVYIKKIKAKELWNSIIHCAWATAEPGILFWDHIQEYGPSNVYPQHKAISTNPCGEIPLSPYDSCRLIAVNLFALVMDAFTSKANVERDIAFAIFYEAQIIADTLAELEIQYVDKIIETTEGSEKELWKKINDIGKQGRRTGTGILGLGDFLAALNKPYYSLEIIEDIMKIKMEAELTASIDLAIINGPFSSFNIDYEYPNGKPGNTFFDNLEKTFPELVAKMKIYGRRNVDWSTINGGLI